MTTTADTSGIVVDAQGVQGQFGGFINGIELAVNQLNTAVKTGPLSNGMDLQVGVINSNDVAYGYIATLQEKSSDAVATGLNLATANNASWDQFLNFSNSNGLKYQMNGDGSSIQNGLGGFLAGAYGRGAIPSSTLAGWQLGWNASNGGGETDFWNGIQGGNTGGFRWYDDVTSTTAPIATLDKTGNLSVTGAVTLPVGQKVNLDVAGGAWVSEDSTGKIVIGAGNTRLFSINPTNGNVIAKGTTTTGTP